MTLTWTPEALGNVLTTALRTGMDNEARSLQSQAGILGPSDLGWCRNKSALRMRKVIPSDSRKPWQMAVGRAVHEYYLGLIKETFPTWLVEAVKVTATLPNGFSLSGTPDVIVPEWNLLGDLKTADGFEWVRRQGNSQNYLFQRHTYLLGAIAAGLIDPAEPITLAEMYVDRSGAEEDGLLVLVDEPDWSLTARIDGWLSDVLDAVENQRFASKDVPAPVCERTCEYFTVCRGSDLPMDPNEEITDPDLIEFVEMYVEGRDEAKTGKAKQDQAKRGLEGVNGHTGKRSVRWTEIDAVRVDAFERAQHWRLDVRDRKGKR